MTQITERIYIGDSSARPDEDSWAVLNVAHDLETEYLAKELAKVGLVDGPGNLPGTLIAAACMLAQLLERHNRVLVHCHGGVSRSGIVVALYIAARAEKMEIDSAIALVQTKRSLVDPVPALRELARKVLPDVRKLVR